MYNIKKYSLLLFILFIIASCELPEDSRLNSFKPDYRDMPKLENPIAVLAGEYEGIAAMRMDETRPINEYPAVFMVSPGKNAADSVQLAASIKPGAMPFPVNYTLQNEAPLKYSKEGYAVSGAFKVDVTLGNGSKKDMPEFYFTLNDRSRFFIDNDGMYCLELYYPDQKMANGNTLPGKCFFKGKRKALK